MSEAAALPVCRIHGRPAVQALLDGAPVLVCVQCAVEGADPCAGLAHAPGRQVNRFRLAGEREEDVQRGIRQALRKAGYRVLSTSRRRRRCVHCGKWSAGGDGVDRGVPDLLVRHPEWPPAVWAGIEVKGARTSLSPEQQELLRAGAIGIARCEADAFGICDVASGYMRTYDPYVTEAGK